MTVPLVFSLFGEAPVALERIAIFQTLFSFTAWLLFAASVSSLITSRVAKLLTFPLLAMGMFSRGSYHFDNRAVSDSLAWSLVLIWFAITLRYDLLRRAMAALFPAVRLPIEAFPFLLLTLATVGARDANAFLLLSALPLLLPLLLARRLTRTDTLAVASVVVVCFLFVLTSSRARTAVNMAHIVAGVVLQKPDVRASFVSHGMPMMPGAAEDYALIAPSDSVRRLTDDRPLVLHDLAAMESLVIDAIPRFLFGPARSIYARWLLTHPRYVLGNIRESWNLMFEQWFGNRARARTPDGRRDLLPHFVWFDWPSTQLALPIVALLLLVAWRFGRGEGALLMAIGAALAASGFSNAVIGFHGDVWERSEMARHCWIGSMTLHLGLAMVVIGASARPEATSRSQLITQLTAGRLNPDGRTDARSRRSPRPAPQPISP